MRGPPSATTFFTVGAAIGFRLVDRVDTHDTHAAGPAQTEGDVTATVVGIHRSPAGVVAELGWASPPDLDWFRLPKEWLLREGALWTLDGPFAPDDASDAALARTGPVLSARDATRGTKSCKETRGTSPYGPSIVRVCFDGKGLLSWLERNTAGPREVALVRR